jgi:hypothetical protein
MKNGFLTVVILVFGLSVSAQNPIVPPGMYIADPEAHVWEDGKLYIYGSRDESADYWCSYDHHVLSTVDMARWNIEENSFSSRGEDDQVASHDKLLFAPDCAYKNGTYYLYYCSPGDIHGEGVATSKSPNGPFINGTDIIGAYQIDPAVFIDDDGQGYYFWGQVKPKVAKLSDDMKSIDTTTISYPLESAAVKFFHEGTSVRKIGNIYYMVFADESRNSTPSCLGYATSSSPMGPYSYKGVIIDNIACDPNVWNNHGSIEQFDGQWYVFYHRSTHGTKLFRKACVEPITINKDGSIDEVEMTSQGAAGPLNAFNQIQAEWACKLSGNLRIEDYKEKDLWHGKLAEVINQDYAAYKYIDFKEGASEFVIKILGASLGGKVEIWTGSIGSGKHIGTCIIDPVKNNNSYGISTCGITETSGIHAVYLKFTGTDAKLFEIDWFSFY